MVRIRQGYGSVYISMIETAIKTYDIAPESVHSELRKSIDFTESSAWFYEYEGTIQINS